MGSWGVGDLLVGYRYQVSGYYKDRRTLSKESFS